MFSKKAREPRKLLRFQKFSHVNVSAQSRTVKQAFKTVWKSSTLVKKAISMINVSKIEQSFQISSEFKLNEGITRFR